MGVARFCATKREGLASVRYRFYQLINATRAAPRGRGRRAGEVAVACLGPPEVVKASRFEIAITKPQVDA